MSSFNDIRKQIAKELEDKQSQDVVAVASKPTPAVTSNGMPNLAARVGPVGTVVSKPGTEKVVLDASTFQFMECVAANASTDKKIRYCIVEKNKVAVYGNQYINSAGTRTHIITRDLYQLLLGIIGSASTQVRNLTASLSQAEEVRDVYKTALDALRKNGVID